MQVIRKYIREHEDKFSEILYDIEISHEIRKYGLTVNEVIALINSGEEIIEGEGKLYVENGLIVNWTPIKRERKQHNRNINNTFGQFNL